MTQVDAVYHFGGRDQVLSESRTSRLVYHDFANLDYSRGVVAPSSPVWCHGYEWKVQLYPGGYTNASQCTSLFLFCISAKPGERVKANIGLRNYRADSMGALNRSVFTSPTTRIGWETLVYRTYPTYGILEQHLVDGNLTLDLTIQVYRDKTTCGRRKRTLIMDMKNFLKSSAADFSDATFVVGNESFPAHLLILRARAPGLAVLVENFPPKTNIPLDSATSHQAFRVLFNYIYLDELPAAEEFQRTAIEILNVADRFGCIGLKLEAEAEIIATGLHAETAADLLLLGDAKNCALLKEGAIDYLVAKSSPVISSSGWLNVKKSTQLLGDLMEAGFLSKNTTCPADPSNESDYARMKVSTLHQKLEEKGLDIDGSKEMLISRLREAEVSAETTDSFHQSV